jgi:hypothetical protein
MRDLDRIGAVVCGFVECGRDEVSKSTTLVEVLGHVGLPDHPGRNRFEPDGLASEAKDGSGLIRQRKSSVATSVVTMVSTRALPPKRMISWGIEGLLGLGIERVGPRPSSPHLLSSTSWANNSDAIDSITYILI